MKLVPILLAIFCGVTAYAQEGSTSSSETYNDLLRLSNSATVMYVAAHPDDENTRLISWLTHAKHVNTVYLSLTRGDGGQNLIGTEKGDLLGVLRTQELLEARKVDKGQQWFTRAVDFGYSKTATETLEIWDRDKILGDVVWAIRVHQPDVMITRFDPDSNGRTHGHHTASAMLAVEAFDLAGDPNAYPEQLEFVEVWQPRRLFFNTSWWFYGSRENFDNADKSRMLSLDVGEYYPTLGLSNNEIASMSRSKHACQGFGSALQRGSQEEWLELLKGDMPTNGDLLQGIDTSWNRYSPTLGDEMAQIISEFDFRNPEQTAHDLLDFRLSNYAHKESIPVRKHQEFQQLVTQASGLYSEVTTREAYAVAKDSIEYNYEVTNRSSQRVPFAVLKIRNYDHTIELGSIEPNQRVTGSVVLANPSSAFASTPYYLQNERETSLYNYEAYGSELLGGRPENFTNVSYSLSYTFQNHLESKLPLTLSNEQIQYKRVDPAIGEIYEPFYFVPEVAINFKDPVYLFSADQPQTVEVEVKSFIDNASGTVQIDAGLNWLTSQAQTFSIANKGETQTVQFTVIPPKTQEMAQLKASAKIGDSSYFDAFHEVNYDHIDKQFIFQTATATIGRIEMEVPDVRVGYIQGSGDVVPQSLAQMHVDVTEITDDFSAANFAEYDVLVVGIRAFNTLDNADVLAAATKEFAKQGGTVIVQYQTSRGLRVRDFAPDGLELGRDRISQEDAALKILDPSHSVFTTPNQITQADFDGWVQERGLYFANQWGDSYTPLLAGHDEGEEEKQGMLLVAPVGEGYYVYTGLSFFRELPAGVPGAYRLFMNLLALE